MVRNADFECYFWKVLFTVLYINKIDCVPYLDGQIVFVSIPFLPIDGGRHMKMLCSYLKSQGDDTHHRTQGGLGSRRRLNGLESFETFLELKTQEVKMDQ